MTFKKTFVKEGVLSDWSFCWSDISSAQPKYNWIVGERMLASDQSQCDNAG